MYNIPNWKFGMLHEETLSDDSYNKGELVEGVKKVYQQGGTNLPSVPATRNQRWLIQPNREK